MWKRYAGDLEKHRGWDQKVNRIISYNKGHELNEISREQTGNK